jgi:hypothetical protein
MLFRAIFFLLINFSAWSEESADNSALGLRKEKPLSIFVAFGSPAPSFAGAGLGFQLYPHLSSTVHYGFARIDELTFDTVAIDLRTNITKTWLAPVVGMGFSRFFIGGYGNYSGLSTSTALGYFVLALDFVHPAGFHLTAGSYLHFPISLNFPFVEFGANF